MLALLQNLSFGLRRGVVARLREIGVAVTYEEWALLTILRADPGLTVSKLARKSDRDPTTTTRTLDRLAKKDLVERRPDPKDRRALRLFLSRNGYEIYAAGAPVVLDYEEEVLAALSETDRQALTASLETLGKVRHS